MESRAPSKPRAIETLAALIVLASCPGPGWAAEVEISREVQTCPLTLITKQQARALPEGFEEGHHRGSSWLGTVSIIAHTTSEPASKTREIEGKSESVGKAKVVKWLLPAAGKGGYQMVCRYSSTDLFLKADLGQGPLECVSFIDTNTMMWTGEHPVTRVECRATRK
jgi:hypothetical protein